jgi:hypothetical protein
MVCPEVLKILLEQKSSAGYGLREGVTTPPIPEMMVTIDDGYRGELCFRHRASLVGRIRARRGAAEA